jgi:hypothetical protein
MLPVRGLVNTPVFMHCLRAAAQPAASVPERLQLLSASEQVLWHACASAWFEVIVIPVKASPAANSADLIIMFPFSNGAGGARLTEKSCTVAIVAQRGFELLLEGARRLSKKR